MTAKALCVGINKFAHLPQASWLNGCVNDALDMAAFLEKRPEFAGGHIKILKDTAATKAKVRLACHPHDPAYPPGGLNGVHHVLGSLDGMKRKTDVDAYLREIAWLERTGKDPALV